MGEVDDHGMIKNKVKNSIHMHLDGSYACIDLARKFLIKITVNQRHQKN
jgi:adenosine deaminase